MDHLGRPAAVKVILIAGSERGGSTLLHDLLAQLPGAFGAGELRYLWNLGIQQNRLCTCGSTFRDCRVWQDILREAYGAQDLAAVAERCLAVRRAVREKHLLLGAVPQGRRAIDRRLEPYGQEIARLFAAIARTQRCRVIIDSSKYASHTLALARLPELDLRVVHLVRDPRGVSYSWLTPKFDRGQGRMMKRRGLVRTSVEWLGFNYLIERICRPDPRRYLRLRYEDLAAAPALALAEIAAFAGEPAAAGLVRGRVAAHRPNHGVSGNTDRFKSGPITITPDTRWRRHMRPQDRLACALLTFPLALRYGYLASQHGTGAPSARDGTVAGAP